MHPQTLTIMKKNFFLPILFLVILMSCNQNENRSKIIIELSGFADSTKIYLFNHETETQDSAYIINNNLDFFAEVNEPTLFSIRTVFNPQKREEFENKLFWKENNMLGIKAEKGNLKNAKIIGSEIQKQLEIIELKQFHLEQINDSLVKEYRALPQEEKEKRLAIRAKGKEITKAITNVEIDYVKNNPNQLYSVITLKRLMTYTIPKDKTRELFDNLSEQMKATKYGVSVKKYLELSLDLKIGDKAPDFQLPDLDGNLIGLSNFKGKYILLDFWSSNCGPCILELPNLLRNYQEYKDRGFEIMSISFDKKKSDWLKAVKDYNMIWTSVSDLKGSDSDVIMTYNVYFMPTYFLIDTEGIIIDKFMGRGQLDEKLKKLFPNE